MCHGGCAGAPCVLPVALGDERHYVFDCPRFAGLRLTHAELFQDASGAMKSLVWHKDQEDVCALLLAIVAQAQT